MGMPHRDHNCHGRGRAPVKSAVRPTTTLAATNLAAPGFAAGVTFQQFVTTITAAGEFNGPALNSLGQTTYWSTVAGPGITAANDLVLWTSGGGTLHVAAREGSQAPGTAAGVMFSSFGFSNISPTGETAFQATLVGPGVNTTDDTGVWLEKNGQLQLVIAGGKSGDRCDQRGKLWLLYRAPLG